MHRYTRSAFRRYPVLFSLLTTFGVVCVLYGLEQILDTIVFIREYPGALFAVGIAILVLTGTLYKKLDRKLD